MAGAMSEERKDLPTFGRGKYFLTRILFLRLLGLVYFVAFAVATTQNKALIGVDGITPFPTRLEHLLVQAQNQRFKAFSENPTLLWYMDWTDQNLLNLSRAGLALSLVPLLLGSCNGIILVSLWVLYTSIVNVGGTWYGFGWENMLLEVGFW